MTDVDFVEQVVRWAGRKKRTVDAGALAAVLRVRGDGVTDVGLWPGGSVVELLLVRWPASGEELPAREVLESTLDTLWRFLRGTGAMAHASAEPKALLREFGQAALLTWRPELPERPVSEEVERQDRLDREAEVRHATVNAERFWVEADRPRGALVPLDGSGSSSTDPAWFEQSSPTKSAPVVRGSVFVQECLRMAEWAGAGVAVSRSGYPGAASLEEDGIGCAVIDPELMWVSCVRGGLVEVVGRQAFSTLSQPCSDEEWADLGLQLVANLLLCLDRAQLPSVAYALTGLLSPGSGGWSREILIEWWWTSTANPVGQQAKQPDPEESEEAALLALELLICLGLVEDAETGRRNFLPTAFGHNVALTVFHLGMQGVFLEAA